MGAGGKRIGAGRPEKFKNYFRQSELPEKIIKKLSKALDNDELTNSELISMLKYCTPQINAQTIDFSNADEQPQINYAQMMLESLKEIESTN